MFGLLGRTAVRTAARPAGRRFFSAESHEAHHIKTMDTWRKISFACVPVLGLLAVVNVGIHMSHEHHEHEAPAFSYNKIRAKKFPWECSGKWLSGA